jgi:hypothetical protein
MPRIRSVKPEFWTDGAMISLPFETRLFYIGSWNFACDRGHLPDDPFGLKLKVLPADPVDGAVLVQQLVDAGRMERVTLPDGRKFLSIPRFTDHQRIDTRWNSRCPVCAHLDSLGETHASFGETRGDSRELIPGGEGRGREGKGLGGEDAHASPSPFCPKHPGGTDRPCRACGNARMAAEAAKAAEKNRPTPLPRRVPECPEHPNWPLPCEKCAAIAAEKIGAAS